MIPYYGELERIDRLKQGLYEDCKSLLITSSRSIAHRIWVWMQERSGRQPIHEFRGEDWERILRVDLDGSYYCSEAVTREMVVGRSGCISQQFLFIIKRGDRKMKHPSTFTILLATIIFLSACTSTQYSHRVYIA